MSDVDRGGGKGGCVGTRIQAEARAKAGSESFLTGSRHGSESAQHSQKSN